MVQIKQKSHPIHADHNRSRAAGNPFHLELLYRHRQFCLLFELLWGLLQGIRKFLRVIHYELHKVSPVDSIARFQVPA